MWELSSFDKVPDGGELYEQEIRLAKSFFESLRRRFFKKIIYIEGNHEFRLKKYLITEAPIIKRLNIITLQSELSLDKFEVEYVECSRNASKWTDVYKMVEEIAVGHFNMVRAASGATAKGLVEKYGCSIIQGHTHRGGVYYKRLLDGKQLVGVENYCMCDLNPSYVKHPNWQSGHSMIVDGKILTYPSILN